MIDTLLDDIGASVSEAASKHADYADIYIQSGASHASSFDDGRLDAVSSTRVDGVGARIVRGDDTAYAHIPGSSARSIASAMDQVSRLTGIEIKRSASGDDELVSRPTLPSIDTSFFHDLNKKLRAECRYVRQVSFRFSTSVKNIAIVRGDGSVVHDARNYTSFSASVVLEKDGSLETGYEARSLQCGVDRFWTLGGARSAEDIAMAALARGVLMLDASPCPAGVMPVLMDGTAGGTMIHEACGHGLEADIIQKDFSVFRDKIGELVANENVTIVDDPTLDGRYGSYAYDDEGTPARRNVLIENGVLKSYMTDVTSARLGSLERTGNGRRESYRCVPMPRMSNTFVTPGTHTRDEILSNMKNGLLVKKMGGGEVDPTSGDFVFYVSEGYLIKDGKVRGAVKGATLTGNGPDVLRSISAVGSELVLDPGTCGKSGQGVPVTDGQPTILIDEMTVGGSDTSDAA